MDFGIVCLRNILTDAFFFFHSLLGIPANLVSFRRCELVLMPHCLIKKKRPIEAFTSGLKSVILSFSLAVFDLFCRISTEAN